MTIEAKCPSCGKRLKAKDEMAGRKAKCPACGSAVQLPEVIYDADEVEADPFSELPDESSQPDAPPDMKECRECGEMILKGAKKCRYCGTRLGKKATPTYQSRPAYSSSSSSGSDDEGMTAVDWLLCFLCPGIACIVGVIRLIQGKPSGGMMIGMSFVIPTVMGVVIKALNVILNQ